MRRWLRNQRGNVLLFTTALALPLMIVFAGLATDMAYFGTVDSELQKAMDAASLAGAGKLGFNSSVFPTVRATAQQYAALNPYKVGNITLNLNTANAPNGNIVLGIWNAGVFTPSLDGSQVNAVQCQYSMPIPMSFLRLLGFNTLTAAASSIAIANPPANPGCGEPILPIAVTPCAFYDAGTGAFNNSNGCGTSLTWISSNRICDNSPGSPQSCNSAAWASLDGSMPNTPYLRNALQNLASPNPTCNVSLNSGQNTTLNNGMIDTVFNTLRDTYLSERTATLPSGDVLLADGTTVAYRASWGGWETGVMMVQSSCPPGPMTGPRQILTYSKFVVTQIFDQNRGCVTSPNMDPQAASYCATSDPSLRAIFGYFKCDQFGAPATLDPVPRTALAPRLRLVR